MDQLFFNEFIILSIDFIVKFSNLFFDELI